MTGTQDGNSPSPSGDQQVAENQSVPYDRFAEKVKAEKAAKAEAEKAAKELAALRQENEQLRQGTQPGEDPVTEQRMAKLETQIALQGRGLSQEQSAEVQAVLDKYSGMSPDDAIALASSRTPELFGGGAGSAGGPQVPPSHNVQGPGGRMAAPRPVAGDPLDEIVEKIQNTKSHSEKQKLGMEGIRQHLNRGFGFPT